MLSIVDKYNINEIVLCDKELSINNMINILDMLKYKKIQYKISPYGKNLIIAKGEVDRFDNIPLLNIKIPYMNRTNILIKRLFDIVLSLLLILLTIPVQLVYLVRYRISHKVINGLNNKKITNHSFVKNEEIKSNIPILYKILLGSVSFVGSEIVEYNENINKQLFIKPGFASVKIENSSKDVDFDYIQNYSFLFDLEILMKSI